MASNNLHHVVLVLALFLPLFSFVAADPVTVPDLSQCQLAVDRPAAGPNAKNTYLFNCCIPIVPAHKVVRFSLDAYKSPKTRVRHPAHRVSEEYIAKYNKAYALMKALPDTDPRSFKVQADLHCAFCNGAYKQGGAAADSAAAAQMAAARQGVEIGRPAGCFVRRFVRRVVHQKYEICHSQVPLPKSLCKAASKYCAFVPKPLNDSILKNAFF